MSDDFLILHARPRGEIERAWLECLDRSEYAGSYSAPSFFDEPWVRGNRPFAILVRSREGKVSAILTGQYQGRNVRCGLSVRPQLCWARDADLAAVAAALERGLAEEAGSAELVEVFSWGELPFGGRFRRREHEGVVMLDLSLGAEALFRSFSENKRTNIKKAIKKGVVVDITADERDVATFHAITEDWSRRKSLPAPDREKFDAAFKMRDQRLLFVARVKGEVVAGIVVRHYRNGMLEYAANSSLESSLHLRPNDLLHWRAIEWACAQGLRKYSLCGAHLFLRKFGGPVVPTYRYRLDRSPLRRHVIVDVAEEAVNAAIKRTPASVLAAARRIRKTLRGGT